MAYAFKKYCSKCEEDTPHTNNCCEKCKARAELKRQEDWMKMSLDEKINNLHERLEKLEGRPSENLLRLIR